MGREAARHTGGRRWLLRGLARASSASGGLDRCGTCVSNIVPYKQGRCRAGGGGRGAARHSAAFQSGSMLYDHSHLYLARSPNHRKAEPALRRIGCEYSHLDLTTQGPPALRGTCYEYSRHRPHAISEPRRGRSGARFGEYAVSIHTSSSCRSRNRRKGQLHVTAARDNYMYPHRWRMLMFWFTSLF